MREAASLNGVANLSELARVAMNRMLSSPITPAGLNEQVRELRGKIDGLSLEIERLSRAMPGAAD